MNPNQAQEPCHLSSLLQQNKKALQASENPNHQKQNSQIKTMSLKSQQMEQNPDQNPYPFPKSKDPMDQNNGRLRWKR